MSIDNTSEWKVGEDLGAGIGKDDEKAILAAVIHGEMTEELVEEHLDELEFLALTAGATTVERVTQKLEHPHRRHYLGSGKLSELKELVKKHDVGMVIFDDDLTGSQINTIEKELKVKIVDRSSLILDIFARRAQTAQAKTQVELAQLQYLLPRLRGMWTHLERQRGGIGMRGPGEKEIETDRRIIRTKISQLQDKLEKIELQNETRRKQRGKMIRVSLVGYTNVGKSTLMNLLSKSEVFAEDKLFATLDTTVRKVVFDRTPFLLSDTVGFIRKLPHHLIDSFKSTLDEVRESDILVHVVDLAHPQYEDHITTVNKTLSDLKALDKPTLMVFNKIDLYRDRNYDELLDRETREEIEAGLKSNFLNKYPEGFVLTSAHTRENIDELRNKLLEMVTLQYEKKYPYQSQKW